MTMVLSVPPTDQRKRQVSDSSLLLFSRSVPTFEVLPYYSKVLK